MALALPAQPRAPTALCDLRYETKSVIVPLEAKTNKKPVGGNVVVGQSRDGQRA